jgi:hypothetical protein
VQPNEAVGFGLQIVGAAMNAYDEREITSHMMFTAIVEDAFVECARDDDPRRAVTDLVYGLALVAQSAAVELSEILDRLAAQLEAALHRGDTARIRAIINEMRQVTHRHIWEAAAMRLSTSFDLGIRQDAPVTES